MQRLTVYESPDVGVEGAEFFLDLEEGLGVADGGFDFQAVANEAGVFEQRAYFAAIEAGNFFWIEVGENAAVVVAFFEHGVPTQASLDSFESEKFEEGAVVVDGDAPFFVVVGDAERVAGPAAADHGFGLQRLKPLFYWLGNAGAKAPAS